MNEEIELKDITLELKNYIKENFIEEIEEDRSADSAVDEFEDYCGARATAYKSVVCYAIPQINLDAVDFQEMYDEEKGETFSNMLMRLIKESGEKNSAIYKRANIDRRHFSKIASNENYRTSKETALAFAIALRLDFDTTQEFLATAGYTLTKTNLADVIVTFFIDHKIFDLNLVNEYLYDYKQPLLGG